MNNENKTVTVLKSNINIDSVNQNVIEFLDQTIHNLMVDIAAVDKDSKIKPDLYKNIALLIGERSKIIKDANSITKEQLEIIMLKKLELNDSE